MIPVSLYGLLIAIGFLAAYGVTIFLATKIGRVSSEHIDRVLLWALIPAVAGARVLFVLYHLDYFPAHPDEIIAVWNGGWVWHGALVGGILGLWAYCKRSGLSLLAFLDLLAPGVALGQAIGRWGNYFNQEAYGFPTDLPIGQYVDLSHRIPGYEAFTHFHPTFLYESIFDAALFILLMTIYLKRWDPRLRGDDKREGGDDPPARKASARHAGGGSIFFLYLILYSLARFGIEFLRIDLVPIAVGLRAPQLVSLGLLTVGIGGLAWVLRKRKNVI